MRALVGTEDRIFDVVLDDRTFPVAPPLRWVEAPDDVDPRTWTWGGSRVVPPSEPTLEERKREKRQEINEARDRASRQPVVYDGNTYDADPRSIRLLTATIAAFNAGIARPSDFAWTTSDDQDVPLTKAQVKELAAAMFLHGQQVHKKSRQLKAQARAATTAAELDEITW